MNGIKGQMKLAVNAGSCTKYSIINDMEKIVVQFPFGLFHYAKPRCFYWNWKATY